MRTWTQKQRDTQRGVTMVELAVVIVIMSLGVVGMGSGVASIVGFYKNDWIMREIRNYGFAAMDEIADLLEDAISVNVDPWSKYDRLYLRVNGITESILIQGTENDGLLKGIEPLVVRYRFPNEGMYREENQRQVTLEGFQVKKMSDVNPIFNSRPSLARVGKAMFDVTLVFGLRTLHPEYGEQVEYTTMHRQVYVKNLLVP